jgi:hypothetical protein
MYDPDGKTWFQSAYNVAYFVLPVMAKSITRCALPVS